MNQPEAKSTPSQSQSDSAPVFQFEDMRLKPGDRLQIQLPASVTEDRHIVRLIGYLEKQSVLITAPAIVNWQKSLVEGDQIVARAFLGQGAFGFVSFLEKIIRAPFEYMHLSFPKEVQGLLLRKAPRVKTDLGATILSAGGDVSAQVANLSATGMMLRTDAPPGTVGEEIQVHLPLDLYDVHTELTLRCRIKTLRASTAEGGQTMHHAGIEFAGLQANDTLILQSVVHHELAKNPYSVA